MHGVDARLRVASDARKLARTECIDPQQPWGCDIHVLVNHEWHIFSTAYGPTPDIARLRAELIEVKLKGKQND